VSAALDALARFAGAHGLTREELSHLSLADLFPPAGGGPPSGAELRRIAADGARAHRLTEALELPSLLLTDDDFAVFERFPTEPNFVTSRRVSGRVAVLSDRDAGRDDLSGAVVLVPQADPGYDWLFAHDIAALVTMYGGANSHMTIRAAEFGLPAAIGVGEALYAELARAPLVVLDCGARYVEPLA
jgi:phosphohistidine swiveling domain-containing protein